MAARRPRRPAPASGERVGRGTVRSRPDLRPRQAAGPAPRRGALGPPRRIWRIDYQGTSVRGWAATGAARRTRAAGGKADPPAAAAPPPWKRTLPAPSPPPTP